jgi:antitoxin component of MazEF toxin-antitoxin module
MLRRKITTSGNSAALVLSQDLLGLMGVKVGDDVEVQVVGRTLVVRPTDVSDRDAKFAEALEFTLRTQHDVLARLAKGDATPKKPART